MSKRRRRRSRALGSSTSTSAFARAAKACGRVLSRNGKRAHAACMRHYIRKG